jgi:hypothetical protein
MPKLKQRRIAAVAVTASRHGCRALSRSAALAHPGKEYPLKLRARRTRVIRTTADLLAPPSVNSEGVSRSAERELDLARCIRMEGLLDLRDLVAGPRGVLVAL